MFDAILKLILLISIVIPYGNDMNITDGKFVFIGTFLLFIVSLFSERKRNIPESNKLFLVAVMAIFSISYWTNGYISNDCSYVFASVFMCVCISAALMIQYVDNFRSVMNFVLIGLVINLFIFLIEYTKLYYIISDKASINPLFFRRGDQYIKVPSACLGNIANFTTYLACLIPLIYNYKIKNIHVGKILTLLFCLIACFGCYDPQMIVLLTAFIVVYLNLENKYHRNILLIFSIPAIGFFEKTISLSIYHRIYHWLMPYYEFKDALLSKGMGLGYYPYETSTHQIGTFLSSHVLLIFQLGLFLSAILYISFFVTHRKQLKFFIPYLVICLVEFPLEIKRLWFLLMFTYSREVSNNV